MNPCLKLQQEINLVFEGKPIAKESARKGRYGNTYNPQSMIMQQYRREARSVLPNAYKMPQRECPVEVFYYAFFDLPKNKKSKKNLELIKNDDYPYLKKVDGDNIIKFYGDIMTKSIFNDDNQVYHNNIKKFYSINPRIEIVVKIYEPIKVF